MVKLKREEVMVIMGTLQVAYPRFYNNLSPEQANLTVDLWAKMLSDVRAEDAALAVNEIIAASKWPPTIAEFREAAKKAEKLKLFERVAGIKLKQTSTAVKDNCMLKRITDKK